MRVLVAEDERITRANLVRQVEAWGHAATAAADGQAAWETFEAGEFDLVLTDWEMPGLSGPELIRRIRQTQRSGYVYIVMLTGRSDKDDVVKGMEAGADDFISKPFHREELRARLQAGDRILRSEQALHRQNTELREANDRIARLYDELGREKQKSDQLLLNVLPGETAEELKRTGRVEPRAFAAVTVCFTDFVGFTASAERLPPAELIQELDAYFRQFDQIVAALGIEKLKTIGDSYMFAAGIPRASATHAVDGVLAALRISRFVAAERLRRQAAGKPAWEMRTGLHTGPAMGGVVGSAKFAYDIWGDTVNTASRMESSGIAGMVNLSLSTYREVQGFFQCEPRGQVATKGKGAMEMYSVLGIRPELADGNGEPSAAFCRAREALGESGARR